MELATTTNFRLLEAPPDIVAARLLGSIIERTIDGTTIRVRIVETEAYAQADAASHSFKGRTARTEVMFGPAGHAYVYFTYGMHYCLNVVTGKEGDGAAVLIRAVEPLEGKSQLQLHRTAAGVSLTNGPAKLCQALAIDKRLNGHNLATLPLKLILKPALRTHEISQTARVGISQAKDVPWRFFITGNAYVSKK